MDGFGIGYIGQEHTDNLMSALKMYYKKSQHIGKVKYNAAQP